MTRVHPLRPDEDSLSLHLLLSALYIQRMQMKLWACLTRIKCLRVCKCFYLPPNTAKDNSRHKKLRKTFALLFEIRNVSCTRDIHRPFKRYRLNDRDYHFPVHLLHDIGPICCYHFYCGFSPSQSVHSDLWIKSRVHLKRLKSRMVESFWRTNRMAFLHRGGVQKARAAGEGYLKLHLTAKSGVMLLVFQILQERSIITLLKNLTVGQFKVQLLIK